MLLDAREFWAEAVSTSVYLWNRCPAEAVNEMIPTKHGKCNCRVFGCDACVHACIPSEASLTMKVDLIELLLNQLTWCYWMPMSLMSFGLRLYLHLSTFEIAAQLKLLMRWSLRSMVWRKCNRRVFGWDVCVHTCIPSEASLTNVYSARISSNGYRALKYILLNINHQTNGYGVLQYRYCCQVNGYRVLNPIETKVFHTHHVQWKKWESKALSNRNPGCKLVLSVVHLQWTVKPPCS